MIPSMSIKKSQKVLSEKCARKQRDPPRSSGKTDKTDQDMKISPIPIADVLQSPLKTHKNLLDALDFGQ